ncbi:MAG: SH3 domain-containing protein [Clostridiales bacterium]|nr:SH3 domain-containing protein [Clostridiales bacterium]
MAAKPSHDKLIHCDACGEDYSATYRRCPFCGERNDPHRSAPPVRDEEDQDDGYVFDGQDAFDDDPEDEYYTPRPKAGKRLAAKQGGRSMDLPPINWPRLITFLCSLVIIVAALIIVFTVIYPQLHGKTPSKPDDSQPPASVEPSADPSGSIVNLPTAPVEPTDTPPVEPTDPPVQTTLTGIALYGSDGRQAEDFTLWVGDSYQLEARFTPADWSGTVIWTSSNPEWVSVSDNGLVANVNNSGAYHNVYITATADGISVQCVVRAQSRKYNEQPTQSTAPAVSDPPAVTTTPPATNTPAPSGTVTVGRTGTIVNAAGGLRVRSGPGTSYEVQDSLVNGNTITVVAEAENGWYQIQYAAGGGTFKTGYIMGEYISTN